jgi:FtsZ-binding cell division protein ZapB
MSVRTPETVDLEAIDRLEEKVKLLIAIVERSRAEQTRLSTENQRLSSELEASRTRLGELERSGGEAAALRDERAVIRARVAEMLQQIESLNL